MAIAESRVAVSGHSPLTLPLRAALHLLMQAQTPRTMPDAPWWDFAVEIRCLIALGLTTSDLRVLVKRGYVKNAPE